MRAIYSQPDQALINLQDKYLEEFDCAFIARCKREGMSEADTCKSLLNSVDRNSLIKLICDSRSKMFPSFAT